MSRARRNRIEAGAIVGAFGLALAFFSTQQGGQVPDMSWSTTQDFSVNQTLQVGAWTPLGTAGELSEDGIYRFCVTAQGTGTMVTEPAALIGTVQLAGGAPVTTCADTHYLPSIEAVRPSATIADPASDVRVLDASWQQLEIGGK